MYFETVQTHKRQMNPYCNFQLCPMSVLDLIPSGKWTGRQPDLKTLRVFDAEMYLRNLDELKKLEERATKSIFVGYCDQILRIQNPLQRLCVKTCPLPQKNLFNNEQEENPGLSITAENQFEEDENNEIENDEHEQNAEEDRVKNKDNQKEIVQPESIKRLQRQSNPPACMISRLYDALRRKRCFVDL